MTAILAGYAKCYETKEVGPNLPAAEFSQQARETNDQDKTSKMNVDDLNTVDEQSSKLQNKLA